MTHTLDYCCTHPGTRYLVEELGLSLTEKDDFGSQPLHWAVLHGHLDTVRWISEYTKYPATRANWAKAFEKVKGEDNNNLDPEP